MRSSWYTLSLFVSLFWKGYTIPTIVAQPFSDAPATVMDIFFYCITIYGVLSWPPAQMLGRRNISGAATIRRNQDSEAEVKCPFCKEDRDKVIDSRSSEGGRVIRRRRLCLACRRRFTTYEKVGDSFKLNVVKKDGTRVPYERDRVLMGLQKACYKRPVSAERIQDIADRVEEDIFRTFDREVSSRYIGELVMRHLRSVDKVAYIRFASVYREFTDAGAFIQEVSQVLSEPEVPDQPTLFQE